MNMTLIIKQKNYMKFTRIKRRRCKEKDLKDVVKFLKQLGPDNIIYLKPSKKYLLWKYQDLRSPSLIIRTKNRIIGMATHMQAKLFTTRGIVKAFWGVDLIVDPFYRKFFLGTQLVPFGEGSMSKDYIRLTFPRTKEISLFFQRFFQRLGWGYFSLSCYGFVFKIGKNQNFNVIFSSIMFKKVNHFNRDINQFFKKVAPQYDWIIYRDKDYLNWRYFSHPFYKYKIIVGLKDKEILGYIIIREEKETQIGYILDILGDLNYPRCIYSLILKSLRYFKEREVKFVYCLLSHKKYMAIFREIGFYPHKKEELLVYSGNTQLQNEFLQKKNWHITMGDGDFQAMK